MTRPCNRGQIITLNVAGFSRLGWTWAATAWSHKREKLG